MSRLQSNFTSLTSRAEASVRRALLDLDGRVDTIQDSSTAHETAHPEFVSLALGPPEAAVDTTGAIAGVYWFPHEAITLIGVYLFVGSATTTGVLTLDINEAGTTVLSTKLTIDATELTSLTAATAAVISDTAIAAGAKIGFDWDGVGDSTATDAMVTLEYTRDVS